MLCPTCEGRGGFDTGLDDVVDYDPEWGVATIPIIEPCEACEGMGYVYEGEIGEAHL